MHDRDIQVELDELRRSIDQIKEQIPPKWFTSALGGILALLTAWLVGWGVWVTSNIYAHDTTIDNYKNQVVEIVELRKDIAELKIKMGVLIDRLDRQHLSSQRTSSLKDN